MNAVVEQRNIVIVTASNQPRLGEPFCSDLELHSGMQNIWKIRYYVQEAIYCSKGRQTFQSYNVLIKSILLGI